MSYNTKNYTEQGGEKTVIGGTLAVEDGATVTGITTATIADNLTTDESGQALSAAQGVVLKSAVDGKVATADIVNDLSTGGTTVPLSAEQGKVLAGRVADNQADSTEATNPTVAEFNALLAKLKLAGLMVDDESE